MTNADLRAALLEIAAAEKAAGAAMFMGKPDRWYEPPHWRCGNDHVTNWFLKSEALGDSVCLANRSENEGCYRTVYLTFPEDMNGPLVHPQPPPETYP